MDGGSKQEGVVASGECFLMSGVFHHSVVHGLGFFIC